MTIYPAGTRGKTELGWLDSAHSFSFGGFYDPERMGFSVLRVLNDDKVAPGGGFATHGHRDMEIVTYVLKGAIAHKDSMGHEEILPEGGVQYMSAGTGITHSEYNASKTESLHFFQIWILPDRAGVTPRYGQVAFDPRDRYGRLFAVATPDGADGSAPLYQDASMYVAHLDPAQSVTHPVAAGRSVYVHVATGVAMVNGEALGEGDGVGLEDAAPVMITAKEETELLLFDLPGET